MREFFDTSVLVAAFLGDHPHHAASARLFAAAAKTRSCCGAHSLAEAYAVLTKLPLKPPIAPEQAMLFLNDVHDRLTSVALSPDEYYATIERASRQAVAGGRLYDALLLRCAVKAKAETIYTWNIKDFQRLAPDIADKIRTP